MKERPILMSVPMVLATLDDTKTQTRRIMQHQPIGYRESETTFETLCGGGGLCVGPSECPEGYRKHRWWRFEPHLNGVIEYARLRQKATPAQIRNAARWHTQKHKPTEWAHDEICGMCPYGQPGDRLWVREPWSITHADFDVREKDRIYVMGRYEADQSPFAVLLTKEESDKLYQWKRTIGRHTSLFMFRSLSRLTIEVEAVRVERLQDISEEDAIAEGIIRHTVTAGRERGDPDYDVFAVRPGNHCEWEMSAKEAYRRLWESINGKGSWDANPFVFAITYKRVTP